MQLSTSIMDTIIKYTFSILFSFLFLKQVIQKPISENNGKRSEKMNTRILVIDIFPALL